VSQRDELATRLQLAPHRAVFQLVLIQGGKLALAGTLIAWRLPI
jgi:hypothetical protein